MSGGGLQNEVARSLGNPLPVFTVAILFWPAFVLQNRPVFVVSPFGEDARLAVFAVHVGERSGRTDTGFFTEAVVAPAEFVNEGFSFFAGHLVPSHEK